MGHSLPKKIINGDLVNKDIIIYCLPHTRVYTAFGAFEAFEGLDAGVFDAGLPDKEEPISPIFCSRNCLTLPMFE